MPKSARASSRRKSPNHSKGLVPVLARLRRGQVAALEREAKRRMGVRGRGRTDVSEVIRDAVSVWMAIRPGQRAIIRAMAAKHELTGPEVLRKALDAWITSLDPRED
ncbi:MAG TPA: hypothetical protein VIV57_16340 [Anaeromyxobacter sp.]